MRNRAAVGARQDTKGNLLMTAHKLSIGLFAGLGLALLGGYWAATGSVEAAGARSHRAGDAPVGSGAEHGAPAQDADKKAKKKLMRF